jgi:hypothetical protein
MRRRHTRSDRLTNKQRRYIRQLQEIFDMLGLDYESIRDYPSAEERTVHLERILVHIIRGEVITQFTLIDELVTHKLARKILADRPKNPRRSKRFQAVKAVLAESRLPLSRKLALLRNLVKVPDDVVASILRVNKIRNHIAHQFFLDDSQRKLKYSGKNILSVEGLRLFQRDQEGIFNYLVLR